jgi:hypothetical protein
MAVNIRAGTVTYDFSGHLADLPITNHGPIGPNTPFFGQFTIDLSATADDTPLAGRVSYEQQLPPAGFLIEIGDVSIRATHATAYLNSGTFFAMYVTGEMVTGSGWTFVSDGINPGGMEFNLGFSDALTDLAHLPNLEGARLPTSTKSSGSLFFGSGAYTYPGGSFAISGSEEIHFNIVSVTLVPEPSSKELAAFALVSILIVCGRGLRAASRDRCASMRT